MTGMTAARPSRSGRRGNDGGGSQQTRNGEQDSDQGGMRPAVPVPPVPCQVGDDRHPPHAGKHTMARGHGLYCRLPKGSVGGFQSQLEFLSQVNREPLGTKPLSEGRVSCHGNRFQAFPVVQGIHDCRCETCSIPGGNREQFAVIKESRSPVFRRL